MICSLTGKITECEQDYFCLLTGESIEWFILASHHTLSSLKIGEYQKILIFIQYKDNGVTLFGFINNNEKILFTNLISVNGIGPKAAIKAISKWNVVDFLTALEEGDSQKIATIPGIGKKTAEKIVLTLKGKIKCLEKNESYEDIIETLTTMGYKKDLARLAILSSIKKLKKEKKRPEDELEEKEIIQYSLRELS